MEILEVYENMIGYVANEYICSLWEYYGKLMWILGEYFTAFRRISMNIAEYICAYLDMRYFLIRIQLPQKYTGTCETQL